MTQKARKLEIDLFESDPRQLTVVRQTGIHDVDGTDVEEAIFVNGSHLEFRVLSGQPRAFRINLRQVAELALAKIGDELKASAPSEAGPL